MAVVPCPVAPCPSAWVETRLWSGIVLSLWLRFMWAWIETRRCSLMNRIYCLFSKSIVPSKRQSSKKDSVARPRERRSRRAPKPQWDSLAISSAKALSSWHSFRVIPFRGFASAVASVMKSIKPWLQASIKTPLGL